MFSWFLLNWGLVVRGLLFLWFGIKALFHSLQWGLLDKDCPVFHKLNSKVSIKVSHRLLREWVFLLISPSPAHAVFDWHSCREDGWICHRLVNCVASLSLTSGLWLLSGSIQNKLADCSHISHSICFDFVECSP